MHKVIKIFSQWRDGTASRDDMRDIVMPLIRSNAHLTEEFLKFFDDERPPLQYVLIIVRLFINTEIFSKCTWGRYINCYYKKIVTFTRRTDSFESTILKSILIT